MDNLEAATRIAEAYIAKTNPDLIIGGYSSEFSGNAELQGQKLGELLSAIYKAVQEATTIRWSIPSPASTPKTDATSSRFSGQGYRSNNVTYSAAEKLFIRVAIIDISEF